jgi:SHS2 domain-containing protein
VAHEFLDHTSETVLRIRAENLAAVLEEAARALGEIEQGGIGGTGEWVTRHFTVESADPAGLLVDFLNELIWLCETEALAPRAARVQLRGQASLEAEVVLERLAATPSLVKAATRHQIRLEPGPVGCEAEVTLDV